MTAKELLGVGIRLLGIWFIVYSLQSLAFGVSYAISQNRVDQTFINTMLSVTPYFLLAMVIASIGFFLIKFPYYLAAKLIPKTGLDNTQIDWEEKLVERIGFVLLGVYILSWAIPDIILNIIYLYKYVGAGPNDEANLTTSKINTFISLIEIVIGLFLVLESRGLVKLIHKLRS